MEHVNIESVLIDAFQKKENCIIHMNDENGTIRYSNFTLKLGIPSTSKRSIIYFKSLQECIKLMLKITNVTLLIFRIQIQFFQFGFSVILNKDQFIDLISSKSDKTISIKNYQDRLTDIKNAINTFCINNMRRFYKNDNAFRLGISELLKDKSWFCELDTIDIKNICFQYILQYTLLEKKTEFIKEYKIIVIACTLEEDAYKLDDGNLHQMKKSICICKVCGVDTPLKCSNCKCVYYCSKEHQTQDWKTHKEGCINSKK